MSKLERGLVAVFCAVMLAAFALVTCGCSAESPSSSGGAAGSSGSAASADAASSGSSSDVESSSSSAAASSAGATEGSSASASKSASSSGASTAVTTDYPGPAFVNESVATTPVETDIPENSILLFDEDKYSSYLSYDMEHGDIPMVCDVWSDEEGYIVSVDVFDPDLIVRIYNLLSKVTVVEESDMSVLDSSYSLTFELINGLFVSYSFEGGNLLNTNNGRYLVEGTDELWRLVNQIQADYLKKVEAKGLREISVAEGDEFIDSYPIKAVPGDLVIVNTMTATDGSMHVAANGVEAKNWGDFCFTFTMPDADVELKSWFSSPPGGGLA